MQTTNNLQVQNTDFNIIDTIFYDELRKCDPALLKITGLSDDIVDTVSALDRLKNNSFSTMADASTDPNANVSDTTYATIIQEAAKGAMKMQSLKSAFRKGYALFGEEAMRDILRKEIEGGLYFSDLHLFDAPYCYNFSASWLLNKGLPFMNKLVSNPAKHADTFLQHAAQLITYASNHQSGACALTGFFWALDYFLRKDGVTSKKAIHQLFQEFTYTINQPFRYSGQSPFLNLSLFCRHYLKSLYGGVPYPDGSYMDVDSVLRLQKMFGEWIVNEITEKKVIFTFPVMTIGILLDEKTREAKDSDLIDWACRTNAPYGTFSFYQSDKASSLSSCCRLSNDLELLQQLGYVNSFGAGGDGIGSTGVVTVNLPQVIFRAAKKERPWKDELADTVFAAERAAFIRNQLVRDNIAKGFLPLYNHGFIDINSQYCTIGICGMYEAARAAEVIKGTLTLDQVEKYEMFAKETLNIINGMNIKASEEFHTPFNLEQVPAEGQAITLALKDRTLGYQNNYMMYSNQWVPLSESNVDVFTRIKLAGELDRACSGGAILHITTGCKVTAEVQKRLLEYCAKSGVVYCAFNYTLVKCNACGGVTSGDISSCPECGATDLDEYSRVVGFITPVRHWHHVRRDEFRKRKRYGNLDPRQKEMQNLKLAS